MRIAVIGAGGTGGYFGSRWAQAGMDVTLLARGRHLEAIQQRGLRVESPHGDQTIPLRAVGHVAEIGPVDFVLVATKQWQMSEAIASLGSLVQPSTLVFGIQNGVEAAEVLGNAIDPRNVLGGTCRIISYLVEPGLIRHVGIPPTITFGELSGGGSARVDQLQSALNLGPELRIISSTDIRNEIWRKFLFFAPLSGVGAVAHAPIGVIREEPKTRRLLKSTMQEVQAIATAEGVQLPSESIGETLDFIDSLPQDGTTSMQRDFQSGRPSELETLVGAVLRIANRHQIATPLNDFIYSALLPLERRARGELDWK